MTDIKELSKCLDDIEAQLGGSNGPTIRIRGFIAYCEQQEPVAWQVQSPCDARMDFGFFKTKTYTVPLYAAPVVPEGWQMVPKEAIMDAVRKYGSTMTNAEILAEYKP